MNVSPDPSAAAEELDERNTARDSATSATVMATFRGGIRALKWLLLSPLLLITAGLELLVSRRGLAVSALALLALLSVSPWLRPAVSRDVRPVHIPLGLWAGSEFNPADLMAQRGIRLDSIAFPLLLVCGAGIVGVLIEPRVMHVFCGTIAMLSIAGTAAMMLNHPMMVEELDNETFHRKEIRSIMRGYGEFLLSSRSGPRIELRHQHNGFIEFTTEHEDPTHAWFYLAWCPWTIMVSLFLSAAVAGGNWQRRIGMSLCWLSAGALLACGVSYRRLAAEYHWTRANRFEARNDLRAAENELNKVIDAMGDFADTRRMWLARGRIAIRSNRDTMESMVFKALQQPQGLGVYDLQFAVQRVPESRTLRNWAADALFTKGKFSLADLSESGAAAYWAAARGIAPWRIDCLLSYAVAFEHAETGAPLELEKLLYPVVPLIGDRLVRADMQSLVGDAYFEAGQIRKAREHYELSMETFCLPRAINVNAQEALLGM